MPGRGGNREAAAGERGGRPRAEQPREHPAKPRSGSWKDRGGRAPSRRRGQPRAPGRHLGHPSARRRPAQPLLHRPSPPQPRRLRGRSRRRGKQAAALGSCRGSHLRPRGSCKSLRRPAGEKHERPDAAGRCPGFVDREFLQGEDRSPPLQGEHLRPRRQGGLRAARGDCCCHLLQSRAPEVGGLRTAIKSEADGQ
ncbi:unnamed protein product [Ectocarpus fasciculatus]